MKNQREMKASTQRDWEKPVSAALGFSLGMYKDRLQKNDLVKLNSKPREIDVHIIDNRYGEGHMENAIGHIFERHNLVELKNPREPLNIDVIWKGISYAAQYKSSGEDKKTGKKGVDAIPIDEVTLTFLRFSKPTGLFNYMKKRGYVIYRYRPGVYYVTGIVDIRIQIIVCRELIGDEFVALRIQGSNVSEEDIRKFIRFAGTLEDEEDREKAESIMRISITENKETYNRLKEVDDKMNDVLEEFMEDRIVARGKAMVNDDREKIASLMLMDSKPISEITKYTSVSEARIRELAVVAGLKIIN